MTGSTAGYSLITTVHAFETGISAISIRKVVTHLFQPILFGLRWQIYLMDMKIQREDIYISSVLFYTDTQLQWSGHTPDDYLSQYV